MRMEIIVVIIYKHWLGRLFALVAISCLVIRDWDGKFCRYRVYQRVYLPDVLDYAIRNCWSSDDGTAHSCLTIALWSSGVFCSPRVFLFGTPGFPSPARISRVRKYTGCHRIKILKFQIIFKNWTKLETKKLIQDTLRRKLKPILKYCCSNF